MEFSEKQSMVKWWWMLLPVFIPVVVVLGAWGSETDPAEKAELMQALPIVIALEGLVAVLLFALRLTYSIDSKGITVAYFPFIRQRTYLWGDVEAAYVRKYNPLGEYGGWGLKGGLKSGKAYNVWGNKGLQLTFKNGKKLLIGTQKAAELSTYLTTLKTDTPALPIQPSQL
ncbi:MAG: hypothetical protein ACO1PI_11535 [Bacteroidota bacterium]